MIEYRRAQAGDADSLTSMRVLMLCDGKQCADGFRELISGNTRRYLQDGFADGSYAAWVATGESEIVAMGGLTLYSLPPNDWCPGGKTAYLSGMYTLPEFRGRGIATKLLGLIMGEAKACGCERILLHATDMGRPLYKAYGFEPSADSMAYYPDRLK